MSELLYEEFQPDPVLRPWLLNYWRFRVGVLAEDAEPHTVWPDGCLSIALLATPSPGPRVFWTGPRITAMQPPLRAHSEMWGLRLWPDCGATVLGRPAATLRDRVGPVDPDVARWAAPLLAATAAREPATVVKALDAALRPIASDWATPDAAIRRAVITIVEQRGDVAMQDVAAVAGMGLRQLQRRFPAATGLTLREWARIRRLRESIALRMRDAAGWSAIAADSGFADHAHLTREYRAMVGLAPTHVADRLDRIEHRNVQP